MKSSESFIWKAICDCSSLIQPVEAWSLGDESKVHFWKDKWLDGATRLFDWVRDVTRYALDWKVCDLVDSGNTWKLDMIQGILPHHAILQILIHLIPSETDGADMIYWAGSSSDVFTVGNAYKSLCDIGMGNVDNTWDLVWHLVVSVFCVAASPWKICHEGVLWLMD